MHLNHLDLSVPDVAAAAAFFVDAFGFTVVDKRGNGGMTILTGDGPFVLVLSRCAEPYYPKTFHIGFLQSSADAVMAAYARLTKAGVEIDEPPREMRGALLFYCRVPGGILVEVAWRPA